jgi:hypothetical protein
VVIDLGILEQPFAGCETAALLKNLQVPDMIANKIKCYSERVCVTFRARKILSQRKQH